MACRFAASVAALVAALALALPAVAPATRGPVAMAAKYGCRGFHIHSDYFRVTVYHHYVRCARARHVLHRFLTGHGRLHGPRDGPSYLQYWTVRGWKCGGGAGGGGCRRHGRYIQAVWV